MFFKIFSNQNDPYNANNIDDYESVLRDRRLLNTFKKQISKKIVWRLIQYFQKFVHFVNGSPVLRLMFLIYLSTLQQL